MSFLDDTDEIPLNVIMDESDEGSLEFNVQEWLNKIKKARQKEQMWRDRAKRCIKIYRDDDTITSNTYASPRPFDDNENTFNILWSNVQVLQPALFSDVPKPDIRNRYLVTDQTSQQVALVIERALAYLLDMYDFTGTMKGAIRDYLLTGRSVVRVRYNQNEAIKLWCELVPWDSFIVEPVERWQDVNWIAFRHLIDRDEFLSLFPDVPLISAIKKKDQFDLEPKYEVFEVWDKKTKQVYFLGQADKPLKIEDDPFGLTGFWPIAEPLYSIMTNSSLVPIPEYTIYQAQAFELNQISYRITDLVKSCKFIGVYDSQQTGLSDLLKSHDSQFVPVTSNLLRSGGIKAVIDSLDTSRISQILTQLYQQREQIKEIIFEVTGISDIIRGDTKATETATAQTIKAKYAGLRLRDRRNNIDRFVVSLLRIKAELLAKYMPIEDLQMMTGVQITPDMVGILQSDILRNYKVDIETDSLILSDMDMESQKRAALVSSITQFISTVAPLVAKGIMPLETAKALLKYALQATKVSREVEDAIEMLGTGQPQQPPQQPVLPGQMAGQNVIPHPRMQQPHMMHPQHRMIPHAPVGPNVQNAPPYTTGPHAPGQPPV